MTSEEADNPFDIPTPEEVSLVIRRAQAGKLSVDDIKRLLQNTRNDEIKAELKQLAQDEIDENAKLGKPD